MKKGTSGMTVAERKLYAEKQRAKIAQLFQQTGGNVSEIARQMNITRSAVQNHMRKLGIKKPLAGGSLEGNKPVVVAPPKRGAIKRFILTSAQNNTYVNRGAWEALLTLARHYGATVMVGTFSYNQNQFGAMAVKAGTKKAYEHDLWFDPSIKRYIVDKKFELAPGLVWCGEMNILPTNENPFSGLETHSHRQSCIFPHVKMRMQSVASMLGEGAKLMYTTGTVTQKNYIQKKEGQKAEHHHVYGGVLVEVNSDGNWWVRQLNYNSQDLIQDLDVIAEDGRITTGHKAEAITWGDLHGTMADPQIVDLSMDMLDTLQPRYQFLHDICSGESFNRHMIKHAPTPHSTFHRWLRGFHRVDAELQATTPLVERYHRDWSEIIVPDSNHDADWFKSWLQKYDYRYDPANMELFLDCQNWFIAQIRSGLMPRDVNIMQYVMAKWGKLTKPVRFLLPDESFTICDKRIECGMHGHLGPAGSMGTPSNLSKIGRRANTAHTHSAGIYNGLYVAGTSSLLKWDYTVGPSSWSHSHIVTYPSGSRTIVTMFAGRWRA
jgi:transposase-like protein